MAVGYLFRQAKRSARLCRPTEARGVQVAPAPPPSYTNRFFLWGRSSKGFLHAGSFRQVGALGPLLPVRWLAPSWHGSFRIIAAGHATGANATVQHRKAVSLVGSIPRTQFEPMGQASGKKQLPMNLCKAAEANKQSDSSMDGSWLASD